MPSIKNKFFLLAIFSCCGRALGAWADGLTTREAYEKPTETLTITVQAVTSAPSVSKGHDATFTGTTTFDSSLLTSTSTATLANATPTSSSAVASGVSTNNLPAIASIVTAIALSIIAIWQGIKYPWREHKARMRALDIERTVAEEALERQRNVVRQGQQGGDDIELQRIEAGEQRATERETVNRTHGLMLRLRPWSAWLLG
ncbi:hypothetical protein FRB94_002720 [Tulasnella sp. JGI-2019a]|nr:hypothetical protein FRB94_002720 [Tulasnella sp. JGI-2019a]KAG9032931.1 hypothetical protein FRB95_000865 [Tulasnella sp. JGI-2019a]